MRRSTVIRFNSDRGAGNYQDKFEKKPVERIKHRSEQKLIARIVSALSKKTDDDWALDMPCGIGRFCTVLKARFPRVVQADGSGQMLRIARQRLGPDAADYLRLSAIDLPFRDEQFGLVYSIRLCHHLPKAEERRKYVEEILRVSNGWVILSFLDTFSPHNVYRSFSRWLKGKPLKWHISEADVTEIAEEQGFAVVKSSLLSRCFSGQRFLLLLRNPAPEAAEAPEGALQDGDAGKHDGMHSVGSADRFEDAVHRSRKGWPERVLHQIDVWRGPVIGLLLAACLLLHVGSIEADYWVLPLGAAVYAAGVALRAWSLMHSGHRLKSASPFATSGPYRWVRNPLYLGNLGIVGGLAIFAETVYLMPFVLAVSAVLYGISARREEARLARICGEAYARYREAVPAWLPGFPVGKRASLSVNSLWPALRGEGPALLAMIPFVLMELYVS